jgi:hypothetical protein
VLLMGYAIVVGRFLRGQELLGLPRRRSIRAAPLIPPRSAGPPARGTPQAARSPAS